LPRYDGSARYVKETPSQSTPLIARDHSSPPVPIQVVNPSTHRTASNKLRSHSGLHASSPAPVQQVSTSNTNAHRARPHAQTPSRSQVTNPVESRGQLETGSYGRTDHARTGSHSQTSTQSQVVDGRETRGQMETGSYGRTDHGRSGSHAKTSSGSQAKNPVEAGGQFETGSYGRTDLARVGSPTRTQTSNQSQVVNRGETRGQTETGSYSRTGYETHPKSTSDPQLDTKKSKSSWGGNLLKGMAKSIITSAANEVVKDTKAVVNTSIGAAFTNLGS